MKKTALVLAVLAFTMTLAPASAATKTKHVKILHYKISNPGVGVLSEDDVGDTNPGTVNPADEIGDVTEGVSEITGAVEDPRPGQGTALDSRPLDGTPADKEFLRNTPGDFYYGGATFDLPRNAEQIKITIVDDLAAATGAPIAWSSCAIHGTWCGDDIQLSGCTPSGKARPLWAYNNVRRIAVWIILNDTANNWNTNCETDSVAMQGYIRLDWYS